MNRLCVNDNFCKGRDFTLWNKGIFKLFIIGIMIYNVKKKWEIYWFSDVFYLYIWLMFYFNIIFLIVRKFFNILYVVKWFIGKLIKVNFCGFLDFYR